MNHMHNETLLDMLVLDMVVCYRQNCRLFIFCFTVVVCERLLLFCNFHQCTAVRSKLRFEFLSSFLLFYLNSLFFFHWLFFFAIYSVAIARCAFLSMRHRVIRTCAAFNPHIHT